MPERTLLRIGAASAIVGAILALLANALYPRVSDPTDTEAFLQKVADSTLWVGDHVAIVVAVLLMTGGMAALYRSITGEPGAALARLGFAAALVGVAVGLVVFAIDGFALKEVAGAGGGQVAEAVVQISFGLFSIWIITYVGVSFILYGLAVALSDVYPRWLGWVAVAGGIGSALVGVIQFYNGPSALLMNALFPAFSILLTIWLLAMGALMWRKASASA